MINVLKKQLPEQIQVITYSYNALLKNKSTDLQSRPKTTHRSAKLFVREWVAKVPGLRNMVTRIRPRKPQKLVVSLGYGSMYNHADSPNLRYELTDDGKAMSYTALRNIDKGEQLTISYYHPEGKEKPLSNSDDKDWFARHRIEKIDL